jgi:hydrogenase maturation protein HypF
MNTKHIAVTGVVQGVGFRPFVYGLARRLELQGWVRNTSAGVEILIQGEDCSVEKFLTALSSQAPPLARIERLTARDETTGVYSRFEIRESHRVADVYQPVSPDVAICSDCERELLDLSDRRYLYPFINCTNCGPRFTIIKDLPYDRLQTTMAGFEMCPDCAAEYADPLDRRFHAEPIACPVCGPFVQLRCAPRPEFAASIIELRLPAILKARQLLRDGRILAVKGIGGFHLACDARNDAAVRELRRRKGRAGKPFALMAADLGTVEEFCEVNDAERAVLTGIERPVVLLRRKTHRGIADAVAPDLDTWGVMLPYTPLHHLLLNQLDAQLTTEPVSPVLVMTSGNFSEEPIAIRDEEALDRLASLADAFLLHNRDIHFRCDDSVVRLDRLQDVARQPPVYLRRSRGYAPYPVALPFESIPILGVGGELKNTFCLARDRHAFLSHHIGDMENAEVYDAFRGSVEQFGSFFRVRPELVAHDLHPDYLTTRYAVSRDHSRCIAVQHHHAHIAACMADNHLTNRKVIGLSFDGTGYGLDGKIWGGEILIASYDEFERAAHLQYLPLPGGDAATRNPWRIAVGYAEALGLDLAGMPFLATVAPRSVQIVRTAVQKNLNVVETSSLGRLFDAVAALAGVRNEVTYEAQAAIELEVLSRANLNEVRPYPFGIQDGIVGLRDLLEQVILDVRRGWPAAVIGARFHLTVSAMAVEICSLLRNSTGIKETVLSGGVWQNQALLGLCRPALEDAGFTVYTHQHVPANDGGLSLGQVAVANFQASL